LANQVRHGLLFVWGEAGPVAQVEASGSPVPVVPELDDPETAAKYNFVSNWFTCLLPYG
jgi:phenylpropionate dioxygenase-like ring-hydroxylating dioxygenase large terminal subunit